MIRLNKFFQSLSFYAKIFFAIFAIDSPVYCNDLINLEGERVMSKYCSDCVFLNQKDKKMDGIYKCKQCKKYVNLLMQHVISFLKIIVLIGMVRVNFMMKVKC